MEIKAIRVMIADVFLTIRETISALLAQDPDIFEVACAVNVR